MLQHGVDRAASALRLDQLSVKKAAAANVITRREEAAATRRLVNTAKLLVEQPLLLRLRELETLKEPAERIDEVRVMLGSDEIEKRRSPSRWCGRALEPSPS